MGTDSKQAMNTNDTQISSIEQHVSTKQETHLATNQQASGVVEDHTIKETKNDKPKHVTWSQDETETPEPQQSLEPKTPETTIVPDELTKVESKDIAVEKELKEEKDGAQQAKPQEKPRIPGKA